MVKIAAPISHLFKQGQYAEKIIMLSDCLECRQWCINARHPKQELVHFDINIIHYWNRKLKYYIKRSINSKIHLELVTFHMASLYDAPLIIKGMYQPGGRKYSRQELLENAKQNIIWLRSILPENVLIGVESNNYYPTPAYNYITDGDFITQVVEENSIKFLFDIAHGKITAHNKSMAYNEYRAMLPLNKTIQVHISNHKINRQNIAIDAHEIPDDEIYHEVKDLITSYPIKYLTIECYHDFEKVIHTMDRFRQLKEEVNNAGRFFE